MAINLLAVMDLGANLIFVLFQNKLKPISNPIYIALLIEWNTAFRLLGHSISLAIGWLRCNKIEANFSFPFPFSVFPQSQGLICLSIWPSQNHMQIF
jgi:hypothetical protein